MSDQIKSRFDQFKENDSPEAMEERAATKTAWKVEQAKIRSEVLELRIKGKSYDAIAKKYGKHKPWAFKIVKDSLKSVWYEKAESLFGLEMQRFDRLQSKLWPKAIGTSKEGPNIDSVKAYIAISDRRKAWEETIHGRKEKSRAPIAITSEKQAWLEAKFKEIEAEYDNEIAGIKALPGRVLSDEDQGIEVHVIDELRPGDA